MQVLCIDKLLTQRYTLTMAKDPKAKGKATEKAGRSVPLQIRLTEDERDKFTEAADADHLTLSAWMRRACWHAVENKHKLGG
jgi:hypothetical protein